MWHPQARRSEETDVDLEQLLDPGDHPFIDHEHDDVIVRLYERVVMRNDHFVVVLGLAIGLLMSVALTRVLQSPLFDTGLLFGVEATDLVTFAGVTVLLAGIAAVACFIAFCTASVHVK